MISLLGNISFGRNKHFILQAKKGKKYQVVPAESSFFFSAFFPESPPFFPESPPLCPSSDGFSVAGKSASCFQSLLVPPELPTAAAAALAAMAALILSMYAHLFSTRISLPATTVSAKQAIRNFNMIEKDVADSNITNGK